MKKRLTNTHLWKMMRAFGWADEQAMKRTNRMIFDWCRRYPNIPLAFETMCQKSIFFVIPFWWFCVAVAFHFTFSVWLCDGIPKIIFDGFKSHPIISMNSSICSSWWWGSWWMFNTLFFTTKGIQHTIFFSLALWLINWNLFIFIYDFPACMEATIMNYILILVLLSVCSG